MLKSADQLADDGEALQRAGSLVIVLSQDQEWMAVEQQVPFIRGSLIPGRTAIGARTPCGGEGECS